MHINLIVGNLCSLLAMGTDSLSSTQKTTKGVLLVQSLSQLIYGIGTAILGGYSGAVQNAVSILRNFVAIRGIKNRYLEWFLVALGVVLGVAFNNLGLLGLLPVVANLQYTLVIFRCGGNQRLLKISFMISVGMFALFNLAILNLVGAVTNLAVVVTTGVVLIRTRKE